MVYIGCRTWLLLRFGLCCSHMGTAFFVQGVKKIPMCIIGGSKMFLGDVFGCHSLDEGEGG